jgi:thiosulfate/3-mercaptopyruvate sulfurtransferase
MSTTPLITAEALRSALNGPTPPLLFDVRFDLSDPQAGARAFAQGHLAGAHYLHLDACCGPKQGADGAFQGRHPLPTRPAFAATLAAFGWQRGRTVVVMDASGGMFAARVWWMLRWLGEASVQVLDGGLPAWVAAGLPLTAEATVAVPVPPPSELAEPLTQQTDAASLRAQLGRVKLFDARAPERFRGDVEPLDAVAGHIPGALNRPFALNLQADGRFLPVDSLRAAWAPLLAGATHSVHQCGSGVTACHNLMALAVAGLADGTLYPGSWSEWSSAPDRPVARA